MYVLNPFEDDECYFVLGKPHYKGRGSRLRAFY